MSKRNFRQTVKYERSYRILEYLRKNSDSGHTITQASLRKVPELSDYIGDKETYNDTIVNMAMAMNFDADELLKPKDEWKINFKQFSCLYGDETNSESGGQTADKDAPPAECLSAVCTITILFLRRNRLSYRKRPLF